MWARPTSEQNQIGRPLAFTKGFRIHEVIGLSFNLPPFASHSPTSRVRKRTLRGLFPRYQQHHIAWVIVGYSPIPGSAQAQNIYASNTSGEHARPFWFSSYSCRRENSRDYRQRINIPTKTRGLRCLYFSKNFRCKRYLIKPYFGVKFNTCPFKVNQGTQLWTHDKYRLNAQL